jgi:UDP-N-acetylglucosamine transferase subunit ALG13
MIFVTVGTEMHFNRMVQPIDEWAARRGRSDVFAQIGTTSWQPRHIKWTAYLDAAESRERIAAAKVVIAHAGMGTILLAREMGKPILVMPRRAELYEHRNDHQMATARQLSAGGLIGAAFDERQLTAKLDELDQLPCPSQISGYASERLLRRITNFIEMGVTDGGPSVPADGDGSAWESPIRSAEGNPSQMR